MEPFRRQILLTQTLISLGFGGGSVSEALARTALGCGDGMEGCEEILRKCMLIPALFGQ